MKNSHADGIAIGGKKRLFIPDEVMIVDAFKRNVLTPLEKMPAASNHCIVSIVAWDIVQGFLKEKGSGESEDFDGLQLSLRLILTTVAENQIMTFSPVFVSNAILESSEDENKDADHLPYADTMMEYVLQELDSFCENVFLKFSGDDWMNICDFILKKYKKIIRRCANEHSEVSYNQEPLC